MASGRRQGGFTYAALLLAVAVIGIGLAAAGQSWSTAAQREREAELLFIGDQYRRALESYWKMSPGPVKTLPTSVGQLLLDDRFPQPVMHLRRAYVDPMAGEDFRLIKTGNVIVGVHSRSKDIPVKQANFPERYAQFESAGSYQQWRFIFTPPRTGPPRPGPARPGT
jgi:type II secretory pathway pseudopilin PulG